MSMSKHSQQLVRGTFSRELVDQVVVAWNGIQNEISQVTRLSTEHSLRADDLNRSSATREQLCTWLQKMSSLLDEFSLPLLMGAMSLSKLVEELKEEKISNQSTIIRLQQMLLGGQESVMVPETPVRPSLSTAASGNDKTTPPPLSKPSLSSTASGNDSSRPSAQDDIQFGAMIEVLRKMAMEENRKNNTMFPLISEEGFTDQIGALLARLGDFNLGSSDHVTQVLQRAKSLRDEEEED
jgi:hypothetical protein